MCSCNRAMVHICRTFLLLFLCGFLADGKHSDYKSSCLIQTAVHHPCHGSSCKRARLVEKDEKTEDKMKVVSDKSQPPHKEDASIAKTGMHPCHGSSCNQSRLVEKEEKTEDKMKVASDKLQPPHKEDASASKDGICEKDVFARPDPCPAHCPYAAEMADKFCHFRCVKPNECGTLGTVPNATIPSDKLHACRFCNVEACKTCTAGPPGAKSEKLERCLECMPGYRLTEEGECAMKGLWVFTVITGVLVAVALTLLAWYLRVLSRPCINQAGLGTAAKARSRTMLLQNA